MDTALQLFLEHGYDDVSVSEICKVLHITKPTFYRYVQAKELVLVNAFEKMQKDVIKEVEQLMKHNQYKDALMYSLTLAHHAASTLGFELFAVYLRSLLSNEGTSWQYSPVLCRLMIESIAKLQQEGTIRNQADPKQIYHLLVHLSQGIAVGWCTEHGAFDLKEFYEKIAGSVLGFS